ncbi:tRNA-splicing endonuclease subunit [Paramarasmius palmivorus]|uniref:tRNA-splicing endonuclease subunit n=1 Tax=Paramarasmius palmivorus TaxID=297713 RepID=A0AAW0DS35_9AGAR
MSDNPIRICIANKRAFIWDVDDIAKIRADHHMCGLLAGTLPHLSQQNMFLGVPLLLMPEEVVLLVENDPIQIQRHLSLNAGFKAKHENRKQQLAAFTSKGLKDGASNRSMSEEAIKKRKERELKKQQKAAQLQQLVSTDDVESPPPLIPEDESQPPTTATTTPANILIPALSSSLEWYSPEQHIYDSIGAAKAAGVWDFPATLQERARCGVYRDLWEQGYFIGIGIKFGAEYLGLSRGSSAIPLALCSDCD